MSHAIAPTASVTSVAASSSALSTTASATAASALEVLWYTRCPVPTGLGIAIQKNWLQESFAKTGTQVKSLRESTEKSVRESHFDHTLTHSVRHGGNIPAIWAKSIGRDTRLLGLSWADEAQLILSRADSGINTPADLKGRRVGLPKWRDVQIDFTRAQALRGLDNALKTVNLTLADVQLIDYLIDAGYSDAPAAPIVQTPAAEQSFAEHSQQNPASDKTAAHGIALHAFQAGQSRARSPEILGLLRGEVDAIFLKGAQAVQIASQFELHTVIDTGAHPDPLIRSNNGTPRTLTVDRDLVDAHYPASVNLLEQVLRAEAWAAANPAITRQYLARETNASEYVVTQAYGQDAHLRLATDLNETSRVALQDFIDFLARHQFIPQSFAVSDWLDNSVINNARARIKHQP